jgi:asparagine synthase (glutamine-hydrolysing)
MARIAGSAGPPGANASDLLGHIAITASVKAVGSDGVTLAGDARAVLHENPGWIVLLDGAVYNPEDLPDGPDDASRIAGAIDRHGIEATLARLNGDFAVAIQDRRSGDLTLARDRFGVRPLYYARAGRPFAFASRPRALLAAPGVTTRVRPDYIATVAVGHYRFFDVEPQRSPFADIDQLPPGHALYHRLGRATIAPYARFAEAEEFPGPMEPVAEEYRALFADAVARRLKRAKRPAFTLSGGLDSSSVVTAAYRQSGVRPHAVSTVYSDEYYDETREIRDVIDAGIADWTPVRVDKPDLFALVAEMVGFHDEPVATVTWMTHYLLARHVRGEGFDALFGGLGGDEQHAGEYDYFFYFFADLLAAGDHDRLAREIERWIGHHDHPVFRKSGDLARRMMAELTDPGRPGQCLPNLSLLGRYRRALDPGFFDLASIRPEFERPLRSYLKCHTLNELTRNTMPCCLRASDRNSAAVGLGDFFPFLDHRLVSFMLRVPTGWKVRDGVTKAFLRIAMKGILPERTRTRVVKTGWNAPAHRWFAEASFAPLMDMIRSRRFAERGIYDVAEAERLALEHRRIVLDGETRDNHMMFLWQLVNLEFWQRSLEGSQSQ